jgi:hypothetical protein
LPASAAAIVGSAWSEFGPPLSKSRCRSSDEVVPVGRPAFVAVPLLPRPETASWSRPGNADEAAAEAAAGHVMYAIFLNAFE